MRKVGFLFLAWSLTCLSPAWSQQQGGSQQGGNQGDTNTGGRPGGGQPGQDRPGMGDRQPRDPFGQRQQTMQMRRPIFLSGKVLLDNGQVPPEPVTIQQVCNGQNQPVTYTDMKGRFSYEVGNNSMMGMSDASSSGMGGGFPGQPNNNGPGAFGNAGVGMGDMGVDMTGCELRADMPGFISESISLGRRRSLDNPDVGVIVLRKIGGYDGSAISVTTMEAPKNARKRYDKALRELQKKDAKLDKATDLLEEAVAEYPRFASAWTYLGETRMRMEDPEGAAAAFDKAIEADSQYLRPYVGLTRVRLRQENWEQVSELSEAVLRLNPAAAQYRYFQAVALFNLGRLDESEAIARSIEDKGEDKEYPQAHQMLGMIHAQRGAFEMAATEFRNYLQMAPNAPSGDDIRRQLNEWQALGVIDKGAATAAAQD